MLGIADLRRADERGALWSLAQRAGKFGVTGASGVAINLGVFSLLTGVLGVHYLLASFAAIETALCSNYLLNNNWTFSDRSTHIISLPSFARYHLVSLGGMLINMMVLHLLVGTLRGQLLLANSVGIGVATIWNFSLNLCWTWRLRLGVVSCGSAE
jgi:dolichol-phosphate mannosyltransferase